MKNSANDYKTTFPEKEELNLNRLFEMTIILLIALMLVLVSFTISGADLKMEFFTQINTEQNS